MDTPPENQEMDQNQKAICTLAIPAGGSRRLLLGGAAVGLTSAAGILLPALQAVAAARHPAQGVQKRNDRRRRKSRNERDRRARSKRNHNKDRKHDSSRPPQLGPSGIKLTVYNNTTTDFDIKCWLGSIGWESQESSFPSQGTFFAGSDDLHVGIEFLTEKLPFIWVENPVAGTPNTTFQYGGSMHFVGYLGGTVEVNHGTLEVGAETTHRIPFTSTRSFGVKVLRESDKPAFKVFTMTVLES